MKPHGRRAHLGARGLLAEVHVSRLLHIISRRNQHLSFAKTSAGRHVVDLSTLIRTQSQLDDPSPVPPASSPPLPVRRPPPARPRELGLAPAARRLQANNDPAPTSPNRSALLGRAGQSLGR